jgi:hypothetical protein
MLDCLYQLVFERLLYPAVYQTVELVSNMKRRQTKIEQLLKVQYWSLCAYRIVASRSPFANLEKRENTR